jgi:alpha-glucosidase
VQTLLGIVTASIVGAVGAAGAAQTARACEGGQSLASPSGAITVDVCVVDGVPTYAVSEHGRTVIAASRLGLEFEGVDLDHDLMVAGAARRSHDETWEQVWGEDRLIRDHYEELRVDLRQRTDPERRVTVTFRAFDEGVAFRYEVPKQRGLERYVLMHEATEFAFADRYAWWIPAYTDQRDELLWRRTRLSEIGGEAAHTPLTIEGEGDAAFVAVHEADLGDFTTMVLRNGGGGRLRVELVPWADGAAVKGEGEMTTPWRVIEIGQRATDLLTNHMVLNLNPPNRLVDTSWIRPRKYIGIWWAMHIGRFSWGSGPNHGATTVNAKAYIDYASMLGIPAVLIEGWNIGWDAPWGDSFDFTHAHPDFDLEAVAEYARARGVELIGHHETGGAITNYERQVDAAFALYRRMGVRTVKTGYVGGKVEGGEWHYGQYMVRHQQMIAEKAAQYGIMLDVHEPVKDTGMRRTLPNVMTREGARGTEWDAWDAAGGNPPSHTTIIPFTRGLSGPFDYTPGIFDLLHGSQPNNRVNTTLAKQLALYVVIYSPLQMAADQPEHYVGHPAFQFIHDVAVDWERTLPIDGEIGGYVTIARKERGGSDWYIGSITNELPRTQTVRMDFLEPGVQYCADVYRDAADTTYQTNPLAYAIDHLTVTSESTLELRLAAGGGQAIRLHPGAPCPL